MFNDLKHRLASAVKQGLYGSRGEPYEVGGRTIRYLPGSRPVRRSYVDSPDINVRHDARQVDLLANQVRPGDVALDVGAHFGQYSLLLAALCGKAGEVVAFEPDPHARAMLLRNIALNPSLKKPTIESIALLDTHGGATLYSHGGNAESSLSFEGASVRDTRTAEEISVETTTLDTYVQKAKLDNVSWIKIDTEGAEIRILRGATATLRSQARILCELHPYAWEAFGTDLRQLQEIVAAAGRTMRYLGSDELVAEPASYGIVLIA